ncbi:MAG: sugar phosphate isomerase/epimerase family protein, partial [Promethearchaeota archaeon]
IDYQMKLADKCIKIANEFNAKFIRAFGFYKLAMFEDEMWPDWLDAVRLLVQKAEASGKIIILENEHSCIFSDLSSIKRTFTEIKSRNLGLLFDPGNLLAGKERFNDEVFDFVKDITVYIHVKDAKITSENPWKIKWCLINEGEVGWRRITKKFTDFGYDSFWSVETHMGKKQAWKNTAENLQRLRDLLS